MPDHTRPYRSGITQFYWWATYMICQPFVRLGRGLRRCSPPFVRLGRQVHRGARWVIEQWGDLMLAPAATSTRTAMGARWLVLLVGLALLVWSVATVVTTV